ncbi:MAG: hypothetical protein JXO22_02870 [Phycisphaerae bacterium]|nr:hypothetical protein [Phycisphaerae bacterium]
MANPTESLGPAPVVLLATTAEQSLTIRPTYEYTLSHDGEDGDGVPETATVYVATDDAVEATPAEGANKLKLRFGMTAVISKAATIRYRVADGTSPVTFTVLRGGLCEVR